MIAVTAINPISYPCCIHRLRAGNFAQFAVDMFQPNDELDGPAQRVIRLYGMYATTHALGQIQKLESMHCHAAADAWRATLSTIENLQRTQTERAGIVPIDVEVGEQALPALSR